MCRTGGPRCDGHRKTAATTGAYADAGETVTVPGNAVGSRRTGRPAASSGGEGGSQVNIGAVTSGGGQVHAGGDIVGQKTVDREPQKKSTAPTREDADRLAAALPADRKDAFGKPLNDAGRRLFALRESGWKGPIDQDGYPVAEGSEPDLHRMHREWASSRISPDQAEELRQMARDRGENPDW